MDSGATVNIGAGDILDIVSSSGPSDTFNNTGQINVLGTSSNYGVLYIGSQPGSGVALTATYGSISVANGFLAAAAADAGAGTITLSGGSETLATASLQNTAIAFASGKNTLALGQTGAGAPSYDSVGTITGFQQGDEIALLSDGSAGAAAASVSYDSTKGVLNVLNGSSQTVASLNIGSGYGNQGFYLWHNPTVDANSAVTSFTEQYDIAVGEVWTGATNNDFMTPSNWSTGVAPVAGGNAIIGSGTAQITSADTTLPSSLNIAVGALQSNFSTTPTSILVVSNTTLSSGLSIDNMAVGGSITSPNATQIMGSALVVDGTVTSQATINVGAGDAESIVAISGSDSFVNQGQINLNGTAGVGGNPGNTAVLFFGPAPGATGVLTATYGAINDSNGFIDANAADSGAGTISLNNGELFVTANLKDTAVQFAGGGAASELALGQTAPGAASYWSIGAITGFQQNDEIALLSDGGAAAAPTALSFSNGVLTLSNAGGVLEKLDVGNSYAGQTFYLTSQANSTDNSPTTSFSTKYDISLGAPAGGTQIASVTAACYCAGTLITTERGEVAVEDLKVGDRALTLSGASRPIVWIGHRVIDIEKHPAPQDVWPVRIAARAFGENLPRRDLWVSPGHNIASEGAIMPACALINGVSVKQVETGRVEYWHLELDAHDIVFAEGLPAESYLDTGNRMDFTDGGAFVEAYPDFNPGHWAETCLPLAKEGPQVQRTRERLLGLLLERGYELSREGQAHIIADGRRIEPVRLSDYRLGFALPAGCGTVALHSNVFVPAHVMAASDDTRELGLSVLRLLVDGDEIALDSADVLGSRWLLGSGWHGPEYVAEKFSHRWTDGAAALPAGARFVIVDLAGHGLYWRAPQELAARIA